MISPKPKYSNWIRMRIIRLLFIISILLIGCGFIPWHFLFRVSAFVLSGLTLITAYIVLSTYLSFSPKGGDYQKKTYNLAGC
jgi:hypothetical protein